MKENAFEGQIYVSVIVFTSLSFLFWLLMQTMAPLEDPFLTVTAAFLAAILEIASASLPYFSGVSAAGAFYVFLILTGTPQLACIVSLLAATLRSAFREHSSLLLKIFSPFQRLLSVQIASLPVLFALDSVAPPFHPLVEGAAAPLYFIMDAITEGTGMGLSFPDVEQRQWFRSRYKTLILTLAVPFLGVVAAFHKQDPVTLIILTICAFLLQVALGTLVQKGPVEAPPPAVEDIDRLREDLYAAEKRYGEKTQQLAQKTFEIGLLLEFGRNIGSNLTLDYAFQVIQEIFKKLFRYQSCVIFFVEEGSETLLRPKRYSTPYAELCKRMHLRLEENVVGAAAKDKRSYVTDFRTRKDLPFLIENEQSEMAVPLIVEDRVRGVIYVGSAEANAYTDADLQIVTTIAYQAAIVLVFAESYEHTVTLATTDGLTGLYTHRYFQERLLEEVKRSERYRQPLSLIMVDLDHFKEYNDSLGHPQGDSLLKSASQVLRDCTRESDVVCRYGGDEFAILLLETTKETAYGIAMRIREAVELRLNQDPRKVKITSSIGVASFPEDATDKSSLLKEADKALYESKHAGRNQVVAARRGA